MSMGTVSEESREEAVADPRSPDAAEERSEPLPETSLPPPGAAVAETLTATAPLRGLLVIALGLSIPVLLTVILSQLAGILQPLFVAVFLCYLILPAHNWLVRHRVPSLISYLFIVGGTIGVLYGVGNMVYGSLDEIWGRLPWYLDRFQSMAVTSLERLQARIPALAEVSLQETLLFEALSAENVTSTTRAAVGNFITFLTNMVVVTFYLIFLMLESRTFEDRVRHAFGVRRTERIMGVVGTINRAISQYVAIKTFVSLLVAGLSMAVLWAFGVDFWLTWGILTFFANFIPYLGSLVVATLPVLLTFLQFDSVWRAAGVAVLLVVVQQVIGYWVEPRLTGRKLGVSPLMILLALAFWGWLWGIVGMILAVPLVVMVKIIMENIEPTRPIAVMISNI